MEVGHLPLPVSLGKVSSVTLIDPRIDHVFCFLYSDALTPWGLVAPPRVSQFLKIVNNSSESMLFNCNQSRAHTPTASFIGSHTLGHYQPSLISQGHIPETCPRATKIVQTSQS